MITKEIKEKFENSNDKLRLLVSNEIIEDTSIQSWDIEEIIKTYFSEEEIGKILENKEFTLEKLKLKDFVVDRIAKDLTSDEIKQRLIKIYPINSMKNVIISCGDEIKIKTVLEEKEQFTSDRVEILKELEVKNLVKFFKENKDFLETNEIYPYMITMALNEEKQKQFVQNIQDLDFTLSEKKEILVTLKDEVKVELSKEELPKEYKSVLDLNVEKYPTRVVLDFDKSLEKYNGLDRLIQINPQKFNEMEREKLFELIDVCPDLTILNSLGDDKFVTFKSTAKEYVEAEKWIDNVIENIDPNYSDAQKLALIDNAIGKKISYSPDFDTEVFDHKESRALWKVISSGYGVCNGISEAESYILKRVGIESEPVSSGKHAFLKVKNIELPFSDGRVEKGDTLLDPTWNLMGNRFNGKVNNFCLSYENLRKNDIDEAGIDHKSHKNDEELKNITLGLDDKSLRELFASVNLADKDGNFLIKNLMDESIKIDKMYANDLKENIRQQFLLLAKNTPEFATCQNSTIPIIKDILLDNENMNFNKCVINRVYDREDDDERKPLIYVYMDSDELGKQFYYADKEKGEFLEIPQEDFEKKFECYDQDLRRSKRN